MQSAPMSQTAISATHSLLSVLDIVDNLVNVLNGLTSPSAALALLGSEESALIGKRSTYEYIKSSFPNMTLQLWIITVLC